MAILFTYSHLHTNQCTCTYRSGSLSSSSSSSSLLSLSSLSSLFWHTQKEKRRYCSIAIIPRLVVVNMHIFAYHIEVGTRTKISIFLFLIPNALIKNINEINENENLFVLFCFHATAFFSLFFFFTFCFYPLVKSTRFIPRMKRSWKKRLACKLKTWIGHMHTQN